MRYHPLVHVTGIVLIVLYCLSLFQNVFRLLLEDISPYAFSQAELAKLALGNGSRALENSTREQIPRIIHQVYLGFDGPEMPESWKTAQQSCIDLHPDFEYTLWTNTSSRLLLQASYPWFLDTWDAYRYPIQRADSIRYFILAHLGGIYIDLDNTCVHPLTPLLTSPTFMPATPIHIGLTNHVMGSRPHSPYFSLLLTRLQAYNRNWLFPYMTVMNSAGPHFVSLVWEEFLQAQRRLRATEEEDVAPGEKQIDGQGQGHGHEGEARLSEVRILMQEEYAGNSWSFFRKEEGGTWNGWDTRVFRWFSTRIPAFVVLCVAGMGAATAAAWWAAWWVGRALRNRYKRGEDDDVLPVWLKAD